MYPIVFERGDRWQVSYFTGPDANRTEVAQAIVDGRTGRGARRVARHAAPRSARARLQRRDRPEGERAHTSGCPLCLLFLVPFFDPRRPFRHAPSRPARAPRPRGLAVLLQPRRDHRLRRAHLPGAALRVRTDAVDRLQPARARRAAHPVDPAALDRDRGGRARLRSDRAEHRRLARDRHRRRRASWAPITSPTGRSSTPGTSPRGSRSAATCTGRSTTSPTSRSS